MVVRRSFRNGDGLAIGQNAPMITSIAEYLRWFGGVNRRAMRDVGSLPETALDWQPGHGEGEDAWTVREIVGHMAASRAFFPHALAGHGWRMDPNLPDLTDVSSCVQALADSADAVAGLVTGLDDALLSVRFESFDDPAVTVAGWRLLMMMAEHDIHHRSQIMTYAGINGWPVKQIFGRTYEEVLQQSR